MHHLISQIQFDLCHSRSYLIRIGAEDRSRINIIGIKLIYHVQRYHIQRGDGIYLVAKKLDAQYIIGVCECYIHYVALHAEATAREFIVVAHVLRLH